MSASALHAGNRHGIDGMSIRYVLEPNMGMGAASAQAGEPRPLKVGIATADSRPLAFCLGLLSGTTQR